MLEWAGQAAGVNFTFDEALLGGAAYDAVGTPYPAETLEKAKSLMRLLGAVGGEMGIARICEAARARVARHPQDLDLFANLRPAMCFAALADASSLA